MWYLQLNTLLALSAFVLIAGLLRKLKPDLDRRLYLGILSAMELVFLGWISIPLCCFYVIYLLYGYLSACLLRRFPKGILMAALAAVALIPFFLVKYVDMGGTLPFVFATIGVSFAVLRQIDVYYHVYFAEQTIEPLTYINYMLFVPVLTSGPIFRYREFDAAAAKPVLLTGEVFADSMKRVIRGMFKKTVVAALCMQLLNSLLQQRMCWYVSLIILVCCYVIMYADLSGYSDIAIAFGAIAGFKVPENFNKPWDSPSFTIFWRRWHISYSSWIRDHIFILLNRRKLKKYQTVILCMVTMMVMSLWYGFSKLYLFDGVYNGVLLSAENVLNLTTVNRRKTKPVVFRLRCIIVSLLFALNTTVFLMEPDQVIWVLRGFLHL